MSHESIDNHNSLVCVLVKAVLDNDLKGRGGGEDDNDN